MSNRRTVSNPKEQEEADAAWFFPDAFSTSIGKAATRSSAYTRFFEKLLDYGGKDAIALQEWMVLSDQPT